MESGQFFVFYPTWGFHSLQTYPQVKKKNQMTLLKKSIVAHLSFPDVANCSFISSNKHATGFGVSVTVASVVRLCYT